MREIFNNRYCSRTIGCCTPYCFLEIVWGEQGFDGGEQSRDRGSPSTPTRETLQSKILEI